ncbi:TetR family transcriptional regulator [Streptomyces sp. NPDC054887]
MAETRKTSSAHDGAQPAPSTPSSLRERTRAAMRAEVSRVAFRLFAEQGFDHTTVDQIAAEAGLSRTTFFRYFGTKEEVVLGKFAEHGHQIAAAVAARPEGEQPWYSLRRAFDVVIQTDPDRPEQSLNLMRLLGDVCALKTRQWEKTQEWQNTLVAEVARRLDTSSDGDLRARAMVASAIACLDAATDAWTAGDGAASLPALLDQAMGALSGLRGEQPAGR